MDEDEELNRLDEQEAMEMLTWEVNEKALIDDVLDSATKIDHRETLAICYIDLLLRHGNVSERVRKLIDSCLESRVPR